MNDNIADQILLTALELAESGSWETLHLYTIAQRLEISLDQIRKYYPQKDDIVEAWFDCADRAVLNIEPSLEFLKLNAHERLHNVIMTWLDTLAPHRRITREMLLYKFEFGHVHLQTLGIMRISRTVQWFREAARVDTTNLQRILEETGTTAIYLMTFARWLSDESVNSTKTREFLNCALLKAEQCGNRVGFN
jgi:AcrR family transcriptional regulator